MSAGVFQSVMHHRGVAIRDSRVDTVTQPAAKWALSLYLAARIAVVPPAGMAASTKAPPVTSPF